MWPKITPFCTGFQVDVHCSMKYVLLSNGLRVGEEDDGEDDEDEEDEEDDDEDGEDGGEDEEDDQNSGSVEH